MNIKKGDTVIRMLAGRYPMPLKVTKVTRFFIVCGPWLFDKFTLCEYDSEIHCPISHLVLTDKQLGDKMTEVRNDDQERKVVCIQE